METINISDFEEITAFKWECPTCDSTNIEWVEPPEWLEAVFCQTCGETFEIES
jgi:transcription elongation factor Elf1